VDEPQGHAAGSEEPDPDVVGDRRLPHDPLDDRPRDDDEGSGEQQQQDGTDTQRTAQQIHWGISGRVSVGVSGGLVAYENR
jgi:hypothetical protein